MGTLPLATAPNLQRFQEFKLKFEEHFHQELRNRILKSYAVEEVEVETTTTTAEVCDEDKVQVLNGSKPANMPLANTAPENKTLAPPPGQSSKPSATPPTAPQRSEPTDLVSAFKEANKMLETFFTAAQLPKGLPEVTETKACGPSSPPDFYFEFSAQRAKATEILRKAPFHDQEARRRATELFESTNYLKYQEIALKFKQRDHMTTVVRNLVDERFSHQRLELKWMETCKSARDVERQFLADDPLELELLKGFGDKWTAFYRESKMDKAQDYFKVLEVLQQYQAQMVGFLDEALCVSVRDLNWFERVSNSKVAAGQKSWGNFRTKLETFLEELKKPLLEQVISNRKSEEACVAKAVEYACEKYKETLWEGMKECGSFEDLHLAVYTLVKECFETVPGFEYTKLWMWPFWEPPRIKQYFKEAQEEDKRRRVASIKERAVSLLEQLEPDQLLKFWKDRFPEVGEELRALVTTTKATSTGGPAIKRLAVESEELFEEAAFKKKVLAVKRAKKDPL